VKLCVSRTKPPPSPSCAPMRTNVLSCDAMSFVVMERMNITDAIAFDRHFAEYGRFA